MVKSCDKTIIENVYKKIIVFTTGTIYNRFISLHIYWVFYVWRGGDSIDIDVHKPWKQSILKEINNAEDGYWRLYEYAAPPAPNYRVGYATVCMMVYGCHCQKSGVKNNNNEKIIL